MIRISILFIALAIARRRIGQPAALSFQAATNRDDSDYQKGLQRARRAAMGSSDCIVRCFGVTTGRRPTQRSTGRLMRRTAPAVAKKRSPRSRELRQTYPSSRWMKDAQALEVEVRAQAGAPVNPERSAGRRSEADGAEQPDAIGSGQGAADSSKTAHEQQLAKDKRSSAFRAGPEFVAARPESSERYRSRFSESGSANESHPLHGHDGQRGCPQGTRFRLQCVFGCAGSSAQFCKSFMQSGSRDFLLNAAKTEQNPELRRDAIRQLALTGGQDELWQLYQSEQFDREQRSHSEIDVLERQLIEAGGDRTHGKGPDVCAWRRSSLLA